MIFNRLIIITKCFSFWLIVLGFPHSSVSKRLCLQCRIPRFNSWVRKIPWRRKWQPTPVFLSGESHRKGTLRGRSQDGRGIGRGDHFLSYKFIERTIERWTKFTKQLLIASSGRQAPRKAAHCLRRDVGQNIKDKKGDKRARDGDPSREGSLNRGSFQSPGNPHAGGSEGSFQILEGNLTGRKN